MSIYRWAKLDDQSGPDRSIELSFQAVAQPYQLSYPQATLFSTAANISTYPVTLLDGLRVKTVSLSCRHPLPTSFSFHPCRVGTSSRVCPPKLPYRPSIDGRERLRSYCNRSTTARRW